MKFKYQARTKDGEIKNGTIEATSEESVFKILKEKGLYMTFIEEDKSSFYSKKISFSKRRIKKKHIAAISRQIAIMFKSKVPLVEIFQTLENQERNERLRDRLFKMRKEVEGGSSLSEAFSMYPDIFSVFYINMVKSGETTGKLVDIFLYLSDFLEKEESLRRKIIGAITYPVLVIFIFMAVGFITILYVIPQMSFLLDEIEGEIPMITRVVMNSSEFFKKYGWILIIALAFFFYFIYKLLKTEKGKIFFQRKMLKVPILKKFLQKFYLNRIALNLSTLISGGLPISLCLEITAKIVGNDLYREILIKTRDEVKQGKSISGALEYYPESISPFFYQMVVVGEKTGTMDSSLTNVMELYEEEIERDIDSFIKILEPLLITFLGIFVGGLMAAVLIPIYSLQVAT